MPDDTDAADAMEQACAHCGADLAPPARFCISCGGAVPAEAPADGDTHDGPPAHAGPNADPGPPADAGPPTAQGRSADAEPAANPPQRAADLGALPPPASGRSASLRCSSCGAVNVRARELCRVCGLDLDPDERTAVPPRPAAQPAEQSAAASRRTRARRRWWVPVLAVVVAVPAVLVTVLLVAGLGPFAEDEQGPLEPVPFPAERYPVLGEVLVLSDVATLTSAPPEDDRAFRPEGMVDGDPRTAWRSDPAELPEAASETVDLVLERPAWITAIAISNGDHHAVEAYEDAGRIHTADLVFDGEVRVRARLQDLGRQRQLLSLEEPVLSTAVRLQITEVTGGRATEGAAVSSIEVQGHVAEGEDTQLAEERAAQRPATGAVVLEQAPALPTGLPWHRPGQGS